MISCLTEKFGALFDEFVVFFFIDFKNLFPDAFSGKNTDESDHFILNLEEDWRDECLWKLRL